MHHFIFSRADAIISSVSSLKSPRFDDSKEMCKEAETIVSYERLPPILTYITGSTDETIVYVYDCFSGYFTGSISGSATFITGTLLVPCPST